MIKTTQRRRKKAKDPGSKHQPSEAGNTNAAMPTVNPDDPSTRIPEILSGIAPPSKPSYKQPPPARRRLQIFAFDPMLGRAAQNRITISVPYETLNPGPQSDRLQVTDYDIARGCYFQPVNLDETNIAMTDGIDPSESDPRFHQQMVYAVARCVLENFDTALGRKLYFRGRRRLRLLPHALPMPNAFYEPSRHAILFGYFRTDNPSVGIPGQTVFSCLSQDIIAHETTHAIVNRLRPRYKDATNPDVPGFHEGFSDIVAIFQHFSFPGILRNFIQESRADLRDAGPLVALAQEFGYATGQGTALRTAVSRADPTSYTTHFEAHERGSILVAAVFEAFFTVYQRRIKDLVRLATGGSGQLPPGDLPPDLVNRVAVEAAKTAQSLLTMCIRAFEYLPPVDVTFGDFLRALVTADFALNPQDEHGQRAAVIDSFSRRGIYPPNVVSLAEREVMLQELNLPPLPLHDMQAELYGWLKDFSANTSSNPEDASSVEAPETPEDEDDREISEQLKGLLYEYASKNAVALGLDPQRPIAVKGFHPSTRIGGDGQLLVELAAQFTQRGEELPDSGGISCRAGVTLVASADGRIRYVARKLLPSQALDAKTNRLAQERLQRIKAFINDCDNRDPMLALGDRAYRDQRIKLRTDFAILHAARGH